MSKLYLFLISLTIVLIFGSPLLAEPANSGFEIGAQVGVARGMTESDAEGIGPDLFMFVQTPLFYKFRANIGAGWGQIKDSEYQTCLFPIEAQLMFFPTSNERWNSYFYLGGGYLKYIVSDLPAVFDFYVDTDASTTFASVGLGATYMINDSWSYDLSGGYNSSFTDNLEGYAKDSNDGYVELLAGIKYRFSLSNKDIDGDGIENKMEDKLGTDKNNPDSDGDGLNDGDEVNTHKTNPLKKDSDKDGLRDKEELWNHKTNPMVADTDGDGLLDGAEVKSHGTDPLKKDSDGDGLNDFDEINKHKTSAIHADTDNDGLTDFEEVMTHKTDPMKGDTDGDGLVDSDEIEKHKTNPLVADSDGGGIDDYTEVQRGTNPLNAEDDIEEEVVEEKIEKAKVDIKALSVGIVFDWDSAAIIPSSAKIIDKVLRVLQDNPEMKVELVGYTDNTGNYQYNVALSLKRADAVKNYLVERGIYAGRMTIMGAGPKTPIAPNDTRKNRRLNRRVEVNEVMINLHE